MITVPDTLSLNTTKPSELDRSTKKTKLLNHKKTG